MNFNGLAIMEVEIKCKMKGNLVKPPMISGLKVGFSQRCPNPQRNQDSGSVLHIFRAHKPTVNRQHHYNLYPHIHTHTHYPPHTPGDSWPSMIGT